jgi:hypothetical protein
LVLGFLEVSVAEAEVVLLLLGLLLLLGFDSFFLVFDVSYNFMNGSIFLVLWETLDFSVSGIS